MARSSGPSGFTDDLGEQVLRSDSKCLDPASGDAWMGSIGLSTVFFSD
jgi:hypothetical protein